METYIPRKNCRPHVPSHPILTSCVSPSFSHLLFNHISTTLALFSYRSLYLPHSLTRSPFSSLPIVAPCSLFISSYSSFSHYVSPSFSHHNILLLSFYFSFPSVFLLTTRSSLFFYSLFPICRKQDYMTFLIWKLINHRFGILRTKKYQTYRSDTGRRVQRLPGAGKHHKVRSSADADTVLVVKPMSECRHREAEHIEEVVDDDDVPGLIEDGSNLKRSLLFFCACSPPKRTLGRT